MSFFPKKSLAFFSLTSCKGCSFSFFGDYKNLCQIMNFYDIHNFPNAQNQDSLEQYDVAIIEGGPNDENEKQLLRKIRKNIKTVIAIGACAHLGGVQSEKNVPQIIKTDYIIPGCPINLSELFQCLMDVYWGKKFTLPNLAVCFECRKNGNKCLVKEGKPCLGPITRAGCNSICVNNGEACLGCRGPKDQANFNKIRQILSEFLSKEELENWLTIYGNLEK